MPATGIEPKPRHDLLCYEDILIIVKLFVKLGLSRFRITGGEPLIRKGMVELIGAIHQIEDVEDLALTTNGTLLVKYAQALKKAGLKRINISLDSLNPEKYFEITRGGNIQDVLAGIDAVIDLGFSPIKLNTVVIRGVNDDELIDFVHFASDKPLEIRFIEFMPLGKEGIWSPEKFISGKEIKARIAKEIPLNLFTDARIEGAGPADYYRLKGSPGTIGFITSLTENICTRCNRIRLTADGQLRSCLMADEEYDLRALLRKKASEEEMLSFIKKAIQQKPQGRCFTADHPQILKSPMSAIGG